MESISVFDIFKIGVGPSSSHTMGPWRAAQRFIKSIGNALDTVTRVRTDLYGSLAKTGKGHGTDFALMLGLSGQDPVTCDPAALPGLIGRIRESKSLALAGTRAIPFDPDRDIVFHLREALPFHANGLRLTAFAGTDEVRSETYYSVGGGFVVQENQPADAAQRVKLPFPIDRAEQLLAYCREQHAAIPAIVRRNEATWRPEEETREGLLRIRRTMQECAFRGCHTEGTLPGGLNVSRRAPGLCQKLLDGLRYRPTVEDWLAAIRASSADFAQILKWVSCFALAVNEENASFGRVVTAPTNGAAGVIPAVLLYHDLFGQGDDNDAVDFLLTAGEIGSLFKKGATISAAMGGCQAEIGVSSAMAAAGLAQVLAGSPEQVCMAAEIAMEHHLGMTCDPIGGLVQIPCIERNTMGAIKAITAANMAVESDPSKAKVSLDGVIKTMWETAKDMGSKYKETAEGGLAVSISVSVSEC